LCTGLVLRAVSFFEMFLIYLRGMFAYHKGVFVEVEDSLNVFEGVPCLLRRMFAYHKVIFVSVEDSLSVLRASLIYWRASLHSINTYFF